MKIEFLNISLTVDDEENDDKVENVLLDEASNVSEPNEPDDSDLADDNFSDEEMEERIVEYDSEENEIEVK